MGVNDAKEQLEVAKAECVRLEAVIEEGRAQRRKERAVLVKRINALEGELNKMMHDQTDLEFRTKTAEGERDEARKVIAGGPRVTEENFRALQGARQEIARLQAELVTQQQVRQGILGELVEVRAERDSLSALHEVATERTVQFAAVIEQAIEALDNMPLRGGASGPGEPFFKVNVKVFNERLAILDKADTDAALRSVRAKAWNEALDHVWELNDRADSIITDTTSKRAVLTSLDILQAKGENPYREGVDRG